MTKNEIQNLIEESRTISTRMLNAILAYLVEHKSSFMETRLAIDEFGEIVLNGVDPDELDSYIWIRVCTDMYHDIWDDVKVIGIEESESNYSGGAVLYYLRPSESEVHTIDLSDISTNEYENVLSLLVSGQPFDTTEIPDLEEEND